MEEKPRASQSAGFELLYFREDRHDRYWGKAVVRAPSGEVHEFEAFDDEFRSTTGALSIGAVYREVQIALRVALLEVHPELILKIVLNEGEEEAP